MSLIETEGEEDKPRYRKSERWFPRLVHAVSAPRIFSRVIILEHKLFKI